MSPCETAKDFREKWAECLQRADKGLRRDSGSEDYWEGFEAIKDLRRRGVLDEAKLISSKPIRRALANTIFEALWNCILRYTEALKRPSKTAARQNSEWLQRLSKRMEDKSLEFADETFRADLLRVAQDLRQLSVALRSSWSVPRGVMGQVIREVGVREPQKSDELDNRFQRDIASLLRFWLGPDVSLLTIARLTVLVMMIAGIAIIDSGNNVVLAHRMKRKILVDEVWQKLHRCSLKNKLLFVHPSEVPLYGKMENPKSQRNAKRQRDLTRRSGPGIKKGP